MVSVNLTLFVWMRILSLHFCDKRNEVRKQKERHDQTRKSEVKQLCS